MEQEFIRLSVKTHLHSTHLLRTVLQWFVVPGWVGLTQLHNTGWPWLSRTLIKSAFCIVFYSVYFNVHVQLHNTTAFFTVKKLLCCISIPSTLFCAHLHFAAPPTLLGLLSCAKTASVCCCISTFYYDTWFFYYNSWMVSRIHLHLINIPHSTNPNIKDVSVKCAMPLQLIYILKSPQILHNSLKFTTANLVPEKTSNEIRWLCSVTLHLCSCAQWNIWLYSYDINKRSL